MSDASNTAGPFARVDAASLSPLRRAIEAMQRAGYDDAPWLRDDLNANVLEARLKAIHRAYEGHGLVNSSVADIAALHSDKGALPTSLQDPMAHAGLRQLWARAEALAQRRGEAIVRQPILATLPTGEVNARALRVVASEEVAIVFDDEIRVLAYLLSKITASVIAVGGAADGGFADIDLNRAADPILASPAAGHWFAALIETYVRDGWIRTLPPWVLAPHQHQLALMLCTGFEHFIIGHELGHLLRGHLDGAMPEALADEPGVSELMKSRLQEIEADAFGLTIACDDAQLEFGSPIPGFWGAYLACKGLELVDRAIYAACKRQDWIERHDAVLAWCDAAFDHPPSMLRPLMLVELIKDPRDRAHCLRFAASINVMFDALFAAALPQFLASAGRGVHKRFHAKFACFAYGAPGPKPGDL